MVSVVASNSVRTTRWIARSVSTSMEAVASSSIRSFGERSNARARHTSCRWPTERLEPPSATCMSSDSGFDLLVSLASCVAAFSASLFQVCCSWTRSIAAQSSCSEASPRGSRFVRSEPLRVQTQFDAHVHAPPSFQQRSIVAATGYTREKRKRRCTTIISTAKAHNRKKEKEQCVRWLI